MMLNVNIYRNNKQDNKEGKFDVFKVHIPDNEQWNALDLMRHISTNMDASLGFYYHSVCNHGICARCSVRSNGKVSLACVTIVPNSGTYTLEPVSEKRCTRDLAIK